MQQVISAYSLRAGDPVGVYRELTDWVQLQKKGLSDHALLELAGVRQKRVLNVGCYLPRDEIRYGYLAKRWVAIDISVPAVHRGKILVQEVLSEAAVERLSFVVGDALTLPFSSESFDLVFSFSMIDQLPTSTLRYQHVKEMVRVARPNGHLVVTATNKLDLLYYLRAVRANRRGSNPNGYEYCFWPWELRWLLTRYGVQVVAFRSSLDLPFSPMNRLLGRARLRHLNPLRYFGDRMGFLVRKPG